MAATPAVEFCAGGDRQVCVPWPARTLWTGTEVVGGADVAGLVRGLGGRWWVAAGGYGYVHRQWRLTGDDGDFDAKGVPGGRLGYEADLAVAEGAVPTANGVKHLQRLPVFGDRPRVGLGNPSGQALGRANIDPGKPEVRPTAPQLDRQQHQLLTGNCSHVYAQRHNRPRRRRHRHVGGKVRAGHGDLEKFGGARTGRRYPAPLGRFRHRNATVVWVQTYLDHAATSPPRPAARQALQSWLDAANASSTHAAGQRARMAVEQARDQVAAALGCSPHDVVFTSGGTEADNLAVKGAAWAARDRSRSTPHLVTTAVEHHAVLDPARWLADRGDVTLTVVDPEPDGRVPVDAVLEAVSEKTALVSVMTANNELGAVNDIAALAAALKEREIPLHTDAVQALATLDVDVDSWGVDALSVSAHKVGGPQGVGVAVLRRGLPVVPLAHGGGQDRGVRSGTFAAALDAACGAAFEEAAATRPELVPRLRTLSDRLASAATSIEGVRRNGPADQAHRLASHVHLSIDEVDDGALSVALDRAGLAGSSGSACGSGAAQASHVLEAAGVVGTPLRLSLGWTTTDAEVDRAIDVLTDTIPTVRATTPAWL